jgi:hypothetical protein
MDQTQLNKLKLRVLALEAQYGIPLNAMATQPDQLFSTKPYHKTPTFDEHCPCPETFLEAKTGGGSTPTTPSHTDRRVARRG